MDTWAGLPDPNLIANNIANNRLHEQQTAARGQIGINMVYRICVLLVRLPVTCPPRLDHVSDIIDVEQNIQF